MVIKQVESHHLFEGKRMMIPIPIFNKSLVAPPKFKFKENWLKRWTGMVKNSPAFKDVFKDICKFDEG